MLQDRLRFLEVANGHEERGQQARHVGRQDEQLWIIGVSDQPRLEHAVRDHRIGSVGRGAPEDVHAREEPARERQVSAALAFGRAAA